MAAGDGLPPRTARLRGLARLLDTAIRIPGTNVRFGLDAIVGLVPGLGDVAGSVMSGYIVVAAARLGASSPVLLRMLVNLGVDALVGAVPLLGDLFDVGWRANTRNVALLEQHLGVETTTVAPVRTSVARIALVVLAAALIVIAGGVLAVLAIRWLVGLMT